MSNESIKRSVDSLQKIYAVIIAIAISQAIIEVVVIKDNQFQTEDFIQNLPSLIAFFSFVVPFYHGMNRHLDNCYIDRETKIQGALLFDFLVFCVESSLLFIFTKLLTSGLAAFKILGWMLVVDMIWGFISHWLHYRKYSPSIIRWEIINFITLFIGVLIFSITGIENKALLLMILSIARLIADYGFSWKFYFPDDDRES